MTWPGAVQMLWGLYPLIPAPSHEGKGEHSEREILWEGTQLAFHDRTLSPDFFFLSTINLAFETRKGYFPRCAVLRLGLVTYWVRVCVCTWGLNEKFPSSSSHILRWLHGKKGRADSHWPARWGLQVSVCRGWLVNRWLVQTVPVILRLQRTLTGLVHPRVLSLTQWVLCLCQSRASIQLEMSAYFA